MNIPEEFGSYLLLKKLSEDSLGETFRAARAGARGIEQVVLLRVLNGVGIDGAKVWQKVSGGAAIQQALRSPNLGTGVDLSRVRNLPYVAYEYIPGKNLATLFAQADKKMSPIPTDHALLIAERVALGLAVASESRVQDQRILHGFVVPHLIMISNEGEARLLGFEIGTGLREAVAGGWRDPAVTPYLAPEALAGQPLAKADDCWSLGALLYELLTGERLPDKPAEGYAAIVDRASQAHDGAPIPPAIADLIKKSLLPREQRVTDAVTWHKTIAKLMIDGHFSPTTFNLAFFMHNLFREEIERENQEMQAEQKLDLRAPAPAVATAPAAAPAGAAAPSREVAAPRTAPPPTHAEKKGNPLLLPIAALLILGLAGGGAWWWFKGRAAATPAPAPAPAVAATPAPAPAASQPGMTPEQIQAQIDQLVQAQMQGRFKEQEDRLKQLQKQLEETRRSGISSAPAPVQVAAVEPTPEPAPRPVSRPVEPPPSPAPAPVQAPAPTPVQTQPQVEPEKPEPAPAPAPAAPRVQVGDLVRPGTGVVSPKLVRLPQPTYPAAARRLNKAATVDVKVLVDERGKVLEAEQSGLRAGFGFDEAAVDVARRAVYNPATKDGVRVKMWTVLRVAFKP